MQKRPILYILLNIILPPLFYQQRSLNEMLFYLLQIPQVSTKTTLSFKSSDWNQFSFITTTAIFPPLTYTDIEQSLLVALRKPNATLSPALSHTVHLNVSVSVTDCKYFLIQGSHFDRRLQYDKQSRSKMIYLSDLLLNLRQRILERSKNCENVLLASSGLSLRPSVRMKQLGS